MSNELHFSLGVIVCSLLSSVSWPFLRKRSRLARSVGLGVLLLAAPVVSASLSAMSAQSRDVRNMIGVTGVVALHLACLEHMLRRNAGLRNGAGGG
jgi:hypothetical protein